MAAAKGIHAHPARKLGVRPADPARLANTLTFRLTGVIPHPLVADHLALVSRWMLGANDRFGTCGPTSIANYVVLLWKYLLGTDITVSDAAVIKLYMASGNPDFNPVTDAGDNGVDMTVMLSALMTVGIDITHADGTVENVRPIVFGKVPTDADDLRAVTSVFGAAILAADLEVAQQAQTDGGLWDYQPSPDWGGHAFMAGKYTSSAAPHTADLTDITWAMPVGASDTFIGHQVQEGYAVVFRPLWDHPVFQSGVDQAALAADFTQVTGKPFTPPDPAPPTPAPPPVPGPAFEPVSPADAAFIQVLTSTDRGRLWLDEHHVGVTAKIARAGIAWLTAKGKMPG
jgi:hypothetical protein